MRSTFGDYRAKMAEEEKKLRLGLQNSFILRIGEKLRNFIAGRRQIQFSNQTNSKSFFVKRSVLSSIGKDKDFQFNFPATTEQLIENLNLNDTDDKSRLTPQNNGISYATTDNGFRFNFNIVEET